MNDVNVVVLSGRLVKDTQYFTLDDGTVIATNSIAVNSYKRKGENDWQQKTVFLYVKAFRQNAETLKQAKKGDWVLITGHLDQYKKEDESTHTHIITEKVKILKPKNPVPYTEPTPQEEVKPDDDLPF